VNLKFWTSKCEPRKVDPEISVCFFFFWLNYANWFFFRFQNGKNLAFLDFQEAKFQKKIWTKSFRFSVLGLACSQKNAKDD
jgi:hypothetical protein